MGLEGRPCVETNGSVMGKDDCVEDALGDWDEVITPKPIERVKTVED